MFFLKGGLDFLDFFLFLFVFFFDILLLVHHFDVFLKRFQRLRVRYTLPTLVKIYANFGKLANWLIIHLCILKIFLYES